MLQSPSQSIYVPNKIKRLNSNNNLDSITINALQSLNQRKSSSVYTGNADTMPSIHRSISANAYSNLEEDDNDSLQDYKWLKQYGQVYYLNEVIEESTCLSERPRSLTISKLPFMIQPLKSLTRTTKIVDQSPQETTPSSPSDSYSCKLCHEYFGTGQALGGHMSRKHPGQSVDYIHKKEIRDKRDIERRKLYIAKLKYFQELGYDYPQLKKSSEGKEVIRKYLNRSKLKRIKLDISVEEASNLKEVEETVS